MTDETVTKKKKDKAEKKLKASEVINWRELIANTDLYDADKFFCDVIMLVDSSATAVKAMNFFIETKSFIMKTITMQNILDTEKKSNDSPKQAWLKQALLDMKNEIKNRNLTTESLAYLVKNQMLIYHDNILQCRQEALQLKAELLEEIRDLERLMEAKPKKKGSAKDKPKQEKKNKGTKKNNKKGPALCSEIAKNLDMIDDIKKDVVSLFKTDYFESDPYECIYFTLCKLHDPNLITELKKIGVNVSAVIDISANECQVSDLPEQTETPPNPFWTPWKLKNYNISLILPENTCYIKYVLPDILEHGLSDSFNKKVEDDIRKIMLNITDFKRQYNNYIDRINFINVKQTKKHMLIDNMNVYNSKMNYVPNECINIPHLMNCLLEEVCTRVDKITEPLENDKQSKSKVPPMKKYHGGPYKQMDTLLKQQERKCIKIQLPKVCKIPRPIHLTYGNVLEYMYGHLSHSNNVFENCIKMQKNVLPLTLFEYFTHKKSDIIFYNYLFYKWSGYLENVTTKELRECIYAFLFTRNNFKNLIFNPNVTVKQNNTIQQLMFHADKPYNQNNNRLESEPELYFEKVEPEITTLPKFTIDTCVQCNNTLKLDFPNRIEEFDTEAMIQVMNQVFIDYKHFDYKYFPPDDIFLLRFHHNIDDFGIEKSVSSVPIRTFICFRDFVAYIIPTIVDFLIEEEIEYWQRRKTEEIENKEAMIEEYEKNEFEREEFLREGSIKFNLLYPKGKPKASPANKATESKDKRRSLLKGSIGKILSRKQVIDLNCFNITLPKKLPVFTLDKDYQFEGYNLGRNYVHSTDETVEFFSRDGIKITVHKQQWMGKDMNYIFHLSANDSTLVLQCHLKDILVPLQPFGFHITVANGIVMAFEDSEIKNIPEDKHLIKEIYEKKSYISSKLPSLKLNEKEKTDSANNSRKNFLLDTLIFALKNKIPTFKIISTRLHKYQYVKRIKSQIQLSVNKILKRIKCKPKLFVRLSKKKRRNEYKCIPYSDWRNKEKQDILNWKGTLPTGLSMQIINPPKPFSSYVKQKYMFDRPDLHKIKDESYRCFLRCGVVLKFLKDGTIITLTSDKTLSHYQFGCFSSNKRGKHKTNIIPLHAYIKNSTRFERKIKKICEKYKKHIIDISDNYRFESSRANCRNLHKVYKLSKKIYNKNSYVIPLINCSIITSEGRRFKIKNNVVYDQPQQYYQVFHTDYLINEHIVHREDGTTWLLTARGESITQFPDGTRITTWYTIIDDNFCVEDTEAEFMQKPETKSNKSISLASDLDKFCQVDSALLKIGTSEKLFDEKINDTYCSEENSSVFNDDNFVLLGMNYKFEHPNYATVIYNCIDGSTEIHMPDNIHVTQFENGMYRTHLLNDDVIEASKKMIEFKTALRTSYYLTSCRLNIRDLLNTNDEEHDSKNLNFLYMRDSINKEFFVNFEGKITNRQYIIPEMVTDDRNSLQRERLFVLKRDLSGEEFHRDYVSHRFLHVLHDMKNNLTSQEFKNNSTEPITIKYVLPLRKNYSEHLMMLYDIPILTTTSEKTNVEKFWRLHNLNMNTFICKRAPVYVIQRLIYNLPVSVVLQPLALAILGRVTEGADMLPVINLTCVASASEVEPISTVVSQKNKPIAPRKRDDIKKLLKYYRELIKKGEIPKYFKNIKGYVFTIVEECSERAMKISDSVHPVKTTRKSIVAVCKDTCPMAYVTSKEKICEPAKTIKSERFEPVAKPSFVTTTDICHQTLTVLSAIEIKKEEELKSMSSDTYQELEEKDVKLKSMSGDTSQELEEKDVELKSMPGNTSQELEEKDVDLCHCDEDIITTANTANSELHTTKGKCDRITCICPPPSIASGKLSTKFCTCSNLFCKCFNNTAEARRSASIKSFTKKEDNVSLASKILNIYFSNKNKQVDTYTNETEKEIKDICISMNICDKDVEDIIKYVKSKLMENEKKSRLKMKDAVHIITQVADDIHKDLRRISSHKLNICDKKKEIKNLTDSILQILMKSTYNENDSIYKIKLILFRSHLPMNEIDQVLNTVNQNIKQYAANSVTRKNRSLSPKLEVLYRNKTEKSGSENLCLMCKTCKEPDEKNYSITKKKNTLIKSNKKLRPIEKNTCNLKSCKHKQKKSLKVDESQKDKYKLVKKKKFEVKKEHNKYTLIHNYFKSGSEQKNRKDEKMLDYFQQQFINNDNDKLKLTNSTMLIEKLNKGDTAEELKPNRPKPPTPHVIQKRESQRRRYQEYVEQPKCDITGNGRNSNSNNNIVTKTKTNSNNKQ